ncbi:MAG: SRPBCC family protein [Planctomycetes bacterium]|nr:SRPBCC family protein [Planctomycetota bacterium]
MPDRIEKTAVLNAPLARVWRAIADAKEFGQWFGAALEGAFVEGQRTRGRITHRGYEHLMLEVTVERVEPQRLLSFRWHPYAVDLRTDYSSEPPTLVEFRLEEAGRNTTLTIVESGFDRIPAERRAEAWRQNDEGWTAQMKAIAEHVGRQAA